MTTHLLLTAAAAWLLLLSTHAGAFEEGECGHDQLRRCRRDGLEAVNSHGSDPDEQCRVLRENFDCLLWQTSMCLDKKEQEGSRDPIVRMWRYLQSFCGTQGSWYARPCFQSENLRRCERLLVAIRGNTADAASCRSFASFRDCARSAVQRDCQGADRRLLGTYLMEKGQQRAWNCPAQRDPALPASLVADEEWGDPQYAYCTDGSRVPLQTCRVEFGDARREARERPDSDLRHHYTCCALVHYESCVRAQLRDQCGDEGRQEAGAIVAEMKRRLDYYSCDDHTDSECSAASPPTVLLQPLLLAALLVLLLVGRSNKV